MKKQKETTIPVDIKVAQPGSVLITNARPLYSPERFGMNPGASPIGPERDPAHEFHWLSHTNGKGGGDE